MAELLLASCADEVAVHTLSGNLSTVVRETKDILGGDEARARNKGIRDDVRPTAVDIDPRGIVICIGREDGSARLWRADTRVTLGDLPAPVDQRGAIHAVAFSSSPRKLATAAEDGVLRIWDLKLMTVAQSFNAFATPATCLSFSADFTRLAAGSTSGDLTVFNLQTNKRTALLKAPTEENSGAQRPAAPLRAVHCSPFRRDVIATCSDAGSVYVWDAMTLTQQASFPRVHRGAASDVAFSPVNRGLLISVGLDGTLLMLDATRSAILRKWPLHHALTSVSFTRCGTRVAVGTSSGRVLLCTLRSTTVVNELEVHVPTPVSCVRFYRPRDDLPSTNSSTSSSSSQVSSRGQARPSHASSGSAGSSRPSKPAPTSTSTSSSSSAADESARAAETNNGASKPIQSQTSLRAPAPQTLQSRKPRQLAASDLFSPAKPPPLPTTTSSLAQEGLKASQLGRIEEDQADQATPAKNDADTLAKDAADPPVAARRPSAPVEQTPQRGKDAQLLTSASASRQPAESAAPSRTHQLAKQDWQAQIPRRAADITPVPARAKLAVEGPTRQEQQSQQTLALEEAESKRSDLEPRREGPSKSSLAMTPAGAPPSEWMAQVEALVDDVRQDVREDVQNVQLEMMRQFRLQMSDIKQTLNAYTSKFSDLVEENNRLRAENARLRNLF